ncbi:hypothetical protein D3C81_1116490 [compost metagenome]
MGAEFLQQQIPSGQCLVHPFALSDVDAYRQMPDPQALLVKHRRCKHVDRQMAAIATNQCPFPRLVSAFVFALHQHRLTGRHRFTVAHAQFCRTGHQLPRQVQAFQGRVAHHLGAVIAEHLLGAGVEGADDAAQVGSNDRHLSRGVQHAAQLTMGAAQFLLAIS